MNDIDANDLIDRLLNEVKSLNLRLALAEQRQAQAEKQATAQCDTCPLNAETGE